MTSCKALLPPAQLISGLTQLTLSYYFTRLYQAVKTSVNIIYVFICHQTPQLEDTESLSLGQDCKLSISSSFMEEPPAHPLLKNRWGRILVWEPTGQWLVETVKAYLKIWRDSTLLFCAEHLHSNQLPQVIICLLKPLYDNVPLLNPEILFLLLTWLKRGNPLILENTQILHTFNSVLFL